VVLSLKKLGLPSKTEGMTKTQGVAERGEGKEKKKAEGLFFFGAKKPRARTTAKSLLFLPTLHLPHILLFCDRGHLGQLRLYFTFLNYILSL